MRISQETDWKVKKSNYNIGKLFIYLSIYLLIWVYITVGCSFKKKKNKI